MADSSPDCSPYCSSAARMSGSYGARTRPVSSGATSRPGTVRFKTACATPPLDSELVTSRPADKFAPSMDSENVDIGLPGAATASAGSCCEICNNSGSLYSNPPGFPVGSTEFPHPAAPSIAATMPNAISLLRRGPYAGSTSSPRRSSARREGTPDGTRNRCSPVCSCSQHHNPSPAIMPVDHGDRLHRIPMDGATMISNAPTEHYAAIAELDALRYQSRAADTSHVLISDKVKHSHLWNPRSSYRGRGRWQGICPAPHRLNRRIGLPRWGVVGRLGLRAVHVAL